MNQFLWITRWNDKRKDSAVTKQKIGFTFLSTYTMEDFKRVLYDLWIGLQMNEGSQTSRYVTFIPPKGNKVIKIRLSDHPSSPQEWGEKELTGLPNRRYSIVTFSKKSMPNESNQGIKELEWKNYIAQNIPTYEKTFNRYYLNETFETLKEILLSIYKGGCPEDNTIKINLAENCNKNMNKKLIRLTESDLHRIVRESVNNVLTELDWKTYMNAAKKDWENGNEERAERFAAAAEDAFNKEFGHDELDDELEYYGEKAHQDVKGANFTPYGNSPSVGIGSWTPLMARMHNTYNPKDGSEFTNPNSTMRPSKKTLDAYNRAKDDLQKHANGKYKYQKGKGWQ